MIYQINSFLISREVIGSGFPRLFLEHSPFDHFCNVQVPLHVSSQSWAFVSRLCLYRFLCCVLLSQRPPHFPSVLFPGFLLAFRLPFSSQLSVIQFLLRVFLGLHPVHSFETIRSFMLLSISAFFPLFHRIVGTCDFFLPTATGPRGRDLAIPHQLLETTMISFTPLPTQGTTHLIELTDVALVCTQWSQLHIEVAGEKEFFRSGSTSSP